MEQSIRKSQSSSQVVASSRRFLAKRGSEVDHSSCNEHYEFYQNQEYMVDQESDTEMETIGLDHLKEKFMNFETAEQQE